MSDTEEKDEPPKIGNILLVDDTPANLKVLTELLKEYNYKVRAVPSGNMALRSVAISPPDLILLDINMPEMNGYEVCQELKGNPKTAHIPVIFISALDDVQDKIQAFRQGGVDYITKPFQIEEVHARIKTHLTIDALQRELQEKNLRLESQLKQLKEMEAKQDTLLHMVVHDIKIPLTGAIGIVELLEERVRGVIPPQFVDLIQQTNRVLDRLHMSMQNILDLGKMERGKISLNYEKLELVSAIQAWLEEIEMLSSHIVLDIRLPDHPVELECDPLILKRVLFNLLSNAFKFTNIAKNVKLAVQVETEAIRIEVIDEGAGVPEKYRELIFEKFQQIQMFEIRDPASSGLGLAFCKMAIEAHHGQIGVESEVGKGSTFWFKLPLKAPITPLETTSPLESH